MDIIHQSYQGLFQKDCPYSYDIKYSGKFKGYNANIMRRRNHIIINMSRNWEDVSEDIKIGLIQELMVKLFKKKQNTYHMDLYNIFLKKVHIAIPKTQSHPVLLESFNRINEKYFLGLVELTNLKWGQHSVRKLGSYDYGTDTITISKVIENTPKFLDYVMYHEMLHKQHKFKSKNGRSLHHSSKFKKAESIFEDANIEEELTRYLSQFPTKKKKIFWSKIFS